MRLARAEELNYFLFIPARLGRVRVEVHTSPLQDQNRNLLYSIVRDVTERETKQALQKAKRVTARRRHYAPGFGRKSWATNSITSITERRSISSASEQMLGEGWQAVRSPGRFARMSETLGILAPKPAATASGISSPGDDGEYLKAAPPPDSTREKSLNDGTSTDINDKDSRSETQPTTPCDADRSAERVKFMNHLERAVSRSECNPAFKFACFFLDLDQHR